MEEMQWGSNSTAFAGLSISQHRIPTPTSIPVMAAARGGNGAGGSGAVLVTAQLLAKYKLLRVGYDPTSGALYGGLSGGLRGYMGRHNGTCFMFGGGIYLRIKNEQLASEERQQLQAAAAANGFWLRSADERALEVYTKLQLSRHLMAKMGYDVLKGRATFAVSLAR
ncbi:hypothetical protein ABPG75_000114 [Micractinium tetrahymenae]